MRLSLDSLVVLDAIDRRGSFAAAAEELHRVPSAVSYAIQRIEDDLDLAVFDRSGHRARLTDAGRALLAEGRLLLEHARTVEHRVRRIASGWEPELVIAVDDLVGTDPLMPLLVDFYDLGAPTRIRIAREVLGGGWDALVSRRADLAVGVSGDCPAGGSGIVTRALGPADLVFAVSPGHPLAAMPDPLAPDLIAAYRVVAVADTSRQLPPRSLGIFAGQETLTVPDFASKLAAQLAGLGVGHLPRHLAAPHLASGRLIEKTPAEARPRSLLSLAWHARPGGPALDWMLARIAALALPGIATGRT